MRLKAKIDGLLVPYMTLASLLLDNKRAAQSAYA